MDKTNVRAQDGNVQNPSGEENDTPKNEISEEEWLVEGDQQQEETQEQEQEQEEETQETEQEEQEETEQKIPSKRPVYTMPVSKAVKEKKRAVEKVRKEYEEKIEQIKKEYEEKLSSYQQNSTASNQQALDNYEAEIEQWAEENDLDPNIVKQLTGVIKKSLLPDLQGLETKLSKLDEIEKEREIQVYKNQVSQEFDSKVINLIKKDYPNATPEHIQKVKQNIMELAFTPEYNTYRVEDIYKVNRDKFEFKNNYGVEPTTRVSEVFDELKELTPEQELELATQNPEKYKEYLEKKEAGLGWS